MPLNLAALRSLLLGCRADGGLARAIPLTERVVPASGRDGSHGHAMHPQKICAVGRL
jgi:hypothetical protein